MTEKIPPGPVGLPHLGSVIPWMRNQPRFLLETYRHYGDVVRFRFLGFRGAILHGAEANRSILIDAVDNFLVGPVRRKGNPSFFCIFVNDRRFHQEAPNFTETFLFCEA